MKKIIVSFLTLIIICTLSSCSNGGRTALLEKDDRVANTYFESLMEAIRNEEIEALSALFSPNGMDEDFDQSAEELFSYFTGDILRYKDWGGAYVEDSMEYGQVFQAMELTYDIVTTDGGYRLALRIVTEDTGRPENVGIHSLYVIKRQEDAFPTYAYWGDGEFTPGIHIGVPNTE